MIGFPILGSIYAAMRTCHARGPSHVHLSGRADSKNMKSLLPMGCVTLIATAFVSAHPTFAAGERPEPSTTMLDNGIKLLLAPIPGTAHVAVQAIYPVGFFHEPAGMTQVSHLMEHLICQSATRNFAAGESFSQLNVRGMANAETLPALTHFDYMLPPGDTDFAFRVEAERLSSLRMSLPVIQQEAFKCYQEVGFVEKNLQAGMVKHAFMALFQAWRHGSRRASIRSGLERIPLKRLTAFRNAWYRPETLTLVVVGAFDKDRALEAARGYLGTLTPIGRPGVAELDWSKIPKKTTVTWDGPIHAVCLALPPAKTATDNLLLSLWGAVLIPQLSVDPEIKRAADMVVSSNVTWPVGPLPFFVYAAAKSEADAKQLEPLLRRKLLQASKAQIKITDIGQLRMFCGQLTQSLDTSAEAVHRNARMVAERTGLGAAKAESMVLGNLALQWGLHEVSGLSVAAYELGRRSVTLKGMRDALDRNIDESRLIVTFLKPGGR